MNPSPFPAARRWLSCFILVAIVSAGGLSAREVLIRNVKVLDPSGETAPQPVTIQIIDDPLRLVSSRPIEASKGAEVIDAQGGYVLGRLEVGGDANLINTRMIYLID